MDICKTTRATEWCSQVVLAGDCSCWIQTLAQIVLGKVFNCWTHPHTDTQGTRTGRVVFTVFGNDGKFGGCSF